MFLVGMARCPRGRCPRAPPPRAARRMPDRPIELPEWLFPIDPKSLEAESEAR